jgi:hypothetical protein
MGLQTVKVPKAKAQKLIVLINIFFTEYSRMVSKTALYQTWFPRISQEINSISKIRKSKGIVCQISRIPGSGLHLLQLKDPNSGPGRKICRIRLKPDVHLIMQLAKLSAAG